MTEYHRLGGLVRDLFSHHSEGQRTRSRCWQDLLSCEASLSLVCRWPASRCVFTWSSLRCVCVLISPKDSHVRLEPTHRLRITFTLSPNTVTLRYWVFLFQHHFKGGHNSAHCVNNCDLYTLSLPELKVSHHYVLF